MSAPRPWRAARSASVRDGDLDPDRRRPRQLEGSIDLVGAEGVEFGADEGARVLAGRSPHPMLSPDPDLPDDTRLWAALQAVGGGTWGGCVYDPDAIIAALQAGFAAEATS